MKRSQVFALSVCLGFIALPAAAYAECPVPNVLTNGQVADASAVMDNFNAVADCAVGTSGTPQAGQIAVFNGSKVVTGGDLSGDVTTSGTTVTALSATGVTPDSYVNPTLTVDSKGRITAAVSGSGGGGSSSSLVLIQRQVLGTAAATVTFSIIPGTYEDLILEVSSRTSGTADEKMTLRFNGDSSANYDYIEENRFGTGQGNGLTAMRTMSLLAMANTFNYSSLTIPSYARNLVHKIAMGKAVNKTSNATAGMSSEQWTGWWRSTATVTSISLGLSGANNFVAGSVFSLYGRL